MCFFWEMVGNLLSESTMIRRKNNVRYVIEAILDESKFKYIKNNIFW